MSRIPYDVHRAQKARERLSTREASVPESETDAESIFSHSSASPYFAHGAFSHSSQRSSAYSHGSPSYHGGQTYLGASGRTMSNTSYGSSYPSSPGYAGRSLSPYSRVPRKLSMESTGLSGAFQTAGVVLPGRTPDVYGLGLGLHPQDIDQAGPSGLRPPMVSKEKDHSSGYQSERQERRRRARQARSTLSGGMYDSPLRRWIRWMGKAGWASASLPLGLALVLAVRMTVWSVSGANPVAGVAQGQWTRFLGQEALWITAVSCWVVKEGRKGRRSWRSQVIGILTILLSPLSLFASDNLKPLLSLTILSVCLLSQAYDHSAVIILLSGIGMAPTTHRVVWPYPLGVGSYLAGKCLWLGGLRGQVWLSSATGFC
ncbi:hypothetical protein IAU60_002919 [Kwoniella sp. DSM 27419]